MVKDSLYTIWNILKKFVLYFSFVTVCITPSWIYEELTQKFPTKDFYVISVTIVIFVIIGTQYRLGSRNNSP